MHSCEPNLALMCRMGDSRVPVLRLQALRNIAAGEPLTLDFGKELCNEGLDFVSCLCSLKRLTHKAEA